MAVKNLVMSRGGGILSGRKYSVIENEWITLQDSTRLAARIWMPENALADPVPAVLEFLPYRKRDGTCVRDEATYPAFAEAGIAGIRVDIRGSGESDGVIDGEYTPLELANACEIIGWIAEQPWSNGSVGMMGISWGGFNCMQVAALKPPALKAVISIASTVDRYNDDIHYKNGTHLSAQLSWATTMLAYQSRSPDKAITGDSWKDMWLERLNGGHFMMEEWLSHQTRDAFWKHGSVGENFTDYNTPSMVIAGWADGYRNTPFKSVESGNRHFTALIGPWVHKYPHFAWPKPRADFLGEAIAWWNHWLRGEANTVPDWPQLRGFIQDGPVAGGRRTEDPGFWVAKSVWSQPETEIYSANTDGILQSGVSNAAACPVYIRSALDTGTTAGEWFTLKPDAEMAGDQVIDDEKSYILETKPFQDARSYLGIPEVELIVASKAPLANLVIRLVDVHPDGRATRISFGVLNLAHRNGYEHPEPMPVDEAVAIRMRLDACGYSLKEGHRLRIAISTAYWPMILPDPYNAGITIDRSSLKLSLPLLGECDYIDMKQPDNEDPLPHYPVLCPAETRRTVERDLMSGCTNYNIYEDTGMSMHPDTGLATRQTREEQWSIHPDNPLSMKGVCEWMTFMERGDWKLKTIAGSQMTCTATSWKISACLQAYEGEQLIFKKEYAAEIPRNYM